MEPSRITAEEAKHKIGHGEELFFLHTRNDEAWAEADRKLPGAMRLRVDEVKLWSHKLPRDQLIVTLLHVTTRSLQCPCGTKIAGCRFQRCHRT